MALGALAKPLAGVGARFRLVVTPLFGRTVAALLVMMHDVLARATRDPLATGLRLDDAALLAAVVGAALLVLVLAHRSLLQVSRLFGFFALTLFDVGQTGAKKLHHRFGGLGHPLVNHIAFVIDDHEKVTTRQVTDVTLGQGDAVISTHFFLAKQTET